MTSSQRYRTFRYILVWAALVLTAISVPFYVIQSMAQYVYEQAGWTFQVPPHVLGTWMGFGILTVAAGKYGFHASIRTLSPVWVTAIIAVLMPAFCSLLRIPAPAFKLFRAAQTGTGLQLLVIGHWLAKHRNWQRRTLQGLIAISFLSSALAVGEWLVQEVMPWNCFVNRRNFWFWPGGGEHTPHTLAYGTLPYLVFCFYLFLSPTDSKRLPYPRRWLAAILLTGLLALTLSSSRSSLLGLTAAVGAGVFLLPNRWRLRLAIPIGATAVVVVFTVFVRQAAVSRLQARAVRLALAMKEAGKAQPRQRSVLPTKSDIHIEATRPSAQDSRQPAPKAGKRKKPLESNPKMRLANSQDGRLQVFWPCFLAVVWENPLGFPGDHKALTAELERCSKKYGFPITDQLKLRMIARNNPHNLVLTAANEQGILAGFATLLLFGYCLAAAAWQIFRAHREKRQFHLIYVSAGATAGVGALFIHGFFHNAGPFTGEMRMWLVIGFSLGCTTALSRLLHVETTNQELDSDRA